MADNEGQSSKPPPGLSLAAPPPAEAPSVPYTAEQERAYRNRSSGSWFDLSPAANAAPAYGRGGGGGRRGGSRGSGKDRGGFAPPPMHFPPPPPTQEQLPPPPPPRFSVRAGTTPLELVPVGTRCTGVVAALRESFGFISSSDFSDQIFFHVSEVLKDGENGEGEEQQQQQSNRQKKQQQQQPQRDIAALVAPGTEVEFTVGARNGRHSALQVRTLPAGSLAPYDVSDERLVGVVERELRGGGGGQGSSRRGGGGEKSYGGRLVLLVSGVSDKEQSSESLAFDAEDLALMGVHDASLAVSSTGSAGFGPPPFDPGPRSGEKVEFSVATDKKTGERRATLLARRRERGIVVHTKRSGEGQGGLFGFIRPIDRRNSDQHVYFHESQVVAMSLPSTTSDDLSSIDPIKPGDEVTMVVAVLDASAGRPSALAVQVQPLGTFPEFVAVPGCERVEGRVIGSGRGAGEGALSIAYIDEETGTEARVLWKAGAPRTEKEGAKKKSGDDDGGGDEDEGGDGDDDASADDEASTAAAADSTSPSSSPVVDDDVVFTLARSTRRLGGGGKEGDFSAGAEAEDLDRKRALDVELVRRGTDRRELGAISALKGSYGLIRCCDRPGTVLFRYEEFFADGEEESAVALSSNADAAAPAADNDEEEEEEEEDDEKGGNSSNKEPSPAAKLARSVLSKNADVEFSIARDARGRAVAVRVRRAPPGSAVFEAVSKKVRQGWVIERLRAKGNMTVSSGVVEFFGEIGGGDDEEEEGKEGSVAASAVATAAAAAAAAAAASTEPALHPDAAATAAALAAATAASIQTGPRSKLPFTALDLADPKINPRVGDAVVFRVATDPRLARAAARRAGAGSAVAKVAGRRASHVAPLVLRGSVAMTKGAFGFLEYDAASLGEALAAGGGAAGVEAAEEKKKKEGEEEVKEVKEEEAATTEGGEENKESDDSADAAAASSSSAAPAAASSSSFAPLSHKTKLRVYFRAGEVEAIIEKSGGSDDGGGEKGKGEQGATTTPTVPVLRRGDLVEFTLAEKPKTRESVAHRVKKIGDAPGMGGGNKGGGLSSSSSRPRLFLAERNPQGIKFTSNAAAGVRGNLAVRLAKCPPEGGARGFTPETSPGSRAALVEKYLEMKAEAEAEAAEAEAAEAAARLNPKAAEFVPPPGLGAALMVTGGAAAPDEEAAAAAAAAAVAKLAVDVKEEKSKEEGGE